MTVTPPAPAIPSSWVAEFKKIAAVVLSVATAVGGVVAGLVNFAPSVHLPAPEVAILVAVSAIIAGIVKELGSVVNTTIKAEKSKK